MAVLISKTTSHLHLKGTVLPITSSTPAKCLSLPDQDPVLAIKVTAKVWSCPTQAVARSMSWMLLMGFMSCLVTFRVMDASAVSRVLGESLHLSSSRI